MDCGRLALKEGGAAPIVPAMNWRDHISVDPQVCHGKPCIKGTRVMVSVILDSLAAGEAAEQLAEWYRISPADVQATLFYAGELTRERILDVPAAGSR